MLSANCTMYNQDYINLKGVDNMIISINSGSSSLKFVACNMRYEILAEGRWEKDAKKFIFKVNGEKTEEPVTFKKHSEACNHVMDLLAEKRLFFDSNQIQFVAHRVVNGGNVFTNPTLVTDESLEKLKELIPLAPLHNPAHIDCAITARKLIPNAYHYFIFDTAFHSSIPKINKIYSLPYECYEEGIQVYGFHGTSHEDMTIRTAELLKINRSRINLVICHLGNGCSVSCVQHGKCIDTSMGMTPLDGLTMGTRSGHIDPGIYPKLIEKYGSVSEVNDVLNKQSGLLGLSGISSDMRTLLQLRDEGNDRAKLAIEKFVQEIRKTIGQYLLELKYDVDAIVFTGGIGENCKQLVREITCGLTKIGVILSQNPNELTAPYSKVKVLQLEANEEIAMAKKMLEYHKTNM